jgi:hypothetical protein
VQHPVDIQAILQRLERLEQERVQQSVESILAKIRAMINKSDRAFDKNEAFDLLIELKALATTEKHRDTPLFQAVFTAMKQKMEVPPQQFRKYLAALLGDKHQEKVFDVLAKVDKSFKLDGELKAQHSNKSPSQGEGPKPKKAIRCYYCDGLGHTRDRCFKRMRDEEKQSGSERKRHREDNQR